MKRVMITLTAVSILLSAVFCSVACSPESTEEQQQESSSLDGTNWSGTLHHWSVTCSFSEKEISIDSDGTQFVGNYYYNYPDISFVAAYKWTNYSGGVESQTISATGIVENSVMKLSVTFKNQYGNVSYSDDILIKN